MAEVVLEHLHKAFGDNVILNDINLSIANEEFVVLVGPSGCGKSTILRLIAGLEAPSSGNIQIEGSVVNAVQPKERDIAMVFQNYALYPHMSVFDNMAFGLKMRKVPKADIQQKVQDAARMLELEHLLDRKPKQLSGGQRQRVALGRAIVRQPKAFLMDEPLSNLDAKLRTQMRLEIRMLHQRLKATTLYVTHDQTEAMTMGDRIVVLNGGVIQQVGPPPEVYHNPANLFVAGFIGQLNTFQVRVDAHQKQLVLLHNQQVLSADLPGIHWEALGACHDSTLLMAFRPEQLHIQPSGVSENTQGWVLEVQPQRIEHLGRELAVYFQWDNRSAVALLSCDTRSVHGYDEKTALQLFLPAQHVMFFHPESGKRIDVSCQ